MKVAEVMNITKNSRNSTSVPKECIWLINLAQGGVAVGPRSLPAGGYPQPIEEIFEWATMSQTASLGLPYARLSTEEAAFGVFADKIFMVEGPDQGVKKKRLDLSEAWKKWRLQARISSILGAVKDPSCDWLSV